MNNSDKHPTMSDEEPDRMSTLPDELLLHILSFLGTKAAVQTCLVSKRWMHLWAFVPCLNFDIEEFGFIDGPVTFNTVWELIFKYMREDSHIQANFIIFVEMVLARHKSSSLNTFRIRYPRMANYDRCSDLVTKGIRCALGSNARGFYLEALIPSIDSFAQIFTSQSIEEMCLKISTRQGLLSAEIIPEVVNLPHVRKLQLKKFLKQTELDERSITRLLSGCPVLEELSLEYCIGKFSSIFSQKLKHLSLCDSCMELPQGRVVLWKFYRARIKPNILGSTVESTFIVDFLPNVLVHFVWSPLEGSAVDGASSFIRDFILHLNFGNCNDLLCGLSGVTLLELCIGDLKAQGVLEAVLPKLGEFHNLRNFSLTGWCTSYNFNPVASFLQEAPNLENLTLYDCGRHCQMADPETHHRSIWVELSRCNKLKKVEIKFLTDYIGAHRFEEAWLSGRTKLQNVEVVLSVCNAPPDLISAVVQDCLLSD